MMSDETLSSRCKKLSAHFAESLPGRLITKESFTEALMAFAKEERAAVWREAVAVGNEQSPHHTACALKWARTCEARAMEEAYERYVY